MHPILKKQAKPNSCTKLVYKIISATEINEGFFLFQLNWATMVML